MTGSNRELAGIALISIGIFLVAGIVTACTTTNNSNLSSKTSYTNGTSLTIIEDSEHGVVCYEYAGVGISCIKTD